MSTPLNSWPKALPCPYWVSWDSSSSSVLFCFLLPRSTLVASTASLFLCLLSFGHSHPPAAFPSQRQSAPTQPPDDSQAGLTLPFLLQDTEREKLDTYPLECVQEGTRIEPGHFAGPSFHVLERQSNLPLFLIFRTPCSHDVRRNLSEGISFLWDVNGAT